MEFHSHIPGGCTWTWRSRISFTKGDTSPRQSVFFDMIWLLFSTRQAGLFCEAVRNENTFTMAPKQPSFAFSAKRDCLRTRSFMRSVVTWQHLKSLYKAFLSEKFLNIMRWNESITLLCCINQILPNVPTWWRFTIPSLPKKEATKWEPKSWHAASNEKRFLLSLWLFAVIYILLMSS